MFTNIVITMAGRGSRFFEAGYTVPKYEIMAHGHSLFAWSMQSLRNFLTPASRVVFVCLAENNSTDFVLDQCRVLGLGKANIVELDRLSDGQATSAYLAREYWVGDAPLLIYNIDTYVNPRSLHPAQIRSGSDGWVPCFQVAGDHWSFVKPGADNWAVDVTEKRRISAYASIGLYWFSRAEQYVDAYQQFFADPANLVSRERYVAPLYRHFIRAGCKISFSDIPVGDVHVLGTPAELNDYLRKSPARFDADARQPQCMGLDSGLAPIR